MLADLALQLLYTTAISRLIDVHLVAASNARLRFDGAGVLVCMAVS